MPVNGAAGGTTSNSLDAMRFDDESSIRVVSEIIMYTAAVLATCGCKRWRFAGFSFSSTGFVGAVLELVVAFAAAGVRCVRFALTFEVAAAAVGTDSTVGERIRFLDLFFVASFAAAAAVIRAFSASAASNSEVSVAFFVRSSLFKICTLLSASATAECETFNAFSSFSYSKYLHSTFDCRLRFVIEIVD